MSTCVATGNTVCYDGERNGLDNAWPGALVLYSVCVCVRVCVNVRRRALGVPDFLRLILHLQTSTTLNKFYMAAHYLAKPVILLDIQYIFC